MGIRELLSITFNEKIDFVKFIQKKMIRQSITSRCLYYLEKDMDLNLIKIFQNKI